MPDSLHVPIQTLRGCAFSSGNSDEVAFVPYVSLGCIACQREELIAGCMARFA